MLGFGYACYCSGLLNRGIHMSTKVIARACVMILAFALGIALFAAPAYAATETWDLAEDFLARADSSGPVIKDVGGDDVWYLKYSGTATNPAAFVPMTTWATNYSWLVQPVPAGIKGWTVGAGGVPHISVNGTGGDLTSSTSPVFTWPAGTVFTHPGPQASATAFSVIEWKSPVTGDAAVSVSLRDADVAGGGSGIDFWVLKNGTVLDSDSVAEGGTGSASVADIEVAPGDSLYLVVGPGALYFWDSTHVVDFGVTVETPDPVVSTPASSPWTLALMALIGLAAVPVIRRVRATA